MIFFFFFPGSRDSSKDRTITRSNGFGPEVQRRILMGTFSLSASNYESYYLQAQKIREQIRKELDGALEKGIDVLLTPTSRSIAPEIKQNESLSQHLTEEQKQKKFINSYLNDVFTVPASLAGYLLFEIYLFYFSNYLFLLISLRNSRNECSSRFFKDRIPSWSSINLW